MLVFVIIIYTRVKTASVLLLVLNMNTIDYVMACKCAVSFVESTQIIFSFVIYSLKLIVKILVRLCASFWMKFDISNNFGTNL